MEVKVNVKLYLQLVKYENNRDMGMILSEASSLGDLIKKLEIPPVEIGIILINGSMASLEDVLKDRDEVKVFPPIIGG